MTDPRHADEGMDARLDPERPDERSAHDAVRPEVGEQESNPLLREGTDAPDAADIEDPERQL